MLTANSDDSCIRTQDRSLGSHRHALLHTTGQSVNENNLFLSSGLVSDADCFIRLHSQALKVDALWGNSHCRKLSRMSRSAFNRVAKGLTANNWWTSMGIPAAAMTAKLNMNVFLRFREQKHKDLPVRKSFVGLAPK